MSETLWEASPHEFGPGKVHIRRLDVSGKTLCGVRIGISDGKTVINKQVNCRGCLNSAEAARERAQSRAEWAQREKARDEADRRWWERYNEYLRSPAWIRRRSAVLERAGYVCEACGTARAEQVHHMTYDHAGNEPLFDLRAVCKPCHDDITHMDRERRDGRWSPW